MYVILERQTPEAIEEIDLRFDGSLIDQVVEYASSDPNCIGLAANQLSVRGHRISKRFFVYDYPRNNKWKVVLNPEIIFMGGKPSVKRESCLTWPGKSVIADRYNSIVVQYTNIEGVNVKKEIYGFEAQIFQHEIDHLNGVEETIIEGAEKNIEEKHGRNDPCHCGSGKKYKKCCIKL